MKTRHETETGEGGEAISTPADSANAGQGAGKSSPDEPAPERKAREAAA